MFLKSFLSLLPSLLFPSLTIGQALKQSPPTASTLSINLTASSLDGRDTQIDDPFFIHNIPMMRNGKPYPNILVAYMDQREFFEPDAHPGRGAIQFRVYTNDPDHGPEPVTGQYCRMKIDCEKQIWNANNGWTWYNADNSVPCLGGMKFAIQDGSFCILKDDKKQFMNMQVALGTQTEQYKVVLQDCEIRDAAAKCKFGTTAPVQWWN